MMSMLRGTVEEVGSAGLGLVSSDFFDAPFMIPKSEGDHKPCY
jgi:hypothetical protein